MKTTYWAMLLMLLPSMAYTQTTEKENEFTMSYPDQTSCRIS